MKSFALPILVAGSAAARTFPMEARHNDCKDVHIFLAKGNNEPYPGRQGKLVNAICDGLPSCDYEDIMFNNPGGSDYCIATNEGMVNGKAQVIAYNEKCPDTTLVLSGFSQGGDVVSSILGGGGGTLFGCTYPPTAPLGANSKAAKKIAAALTFGDVRHTKDQPWNVLGGASGQGILPRTPEMLAELALYGPRFRDYCNAGDGVCGDGNIVDEHLNYFDKYSNIAADFVHERLSAFAGPASSAVASSASASATKTATFTPPSNGTATTGHGSAVTSPPVTVPHHGDNPATAQQPNPITTVVTQTLTVTEDCESKGSTYYETVTVTAKCPICTKVPAYSTASDLFEGPSTTGKPQGDFVTGGNHIPGQTGGANHPVQTGGSHWTTAYAPGTNGTATRGPGAPIKPTSAPGGSPITTAAPVSGAAAMLPQLAGVVAAVAVVMAL